MPSLPWQYDQLRAWEFKLFAVSKTPNDKAESSTKILWRCDGSLFGTHISFHISNLRPRSLCFVFLWKRNKSYPFRPCVHTDKMGLEISYSLGAVWTLHRIHSVFAWKRSSLNQHCLPSSYTETYRLLSGARIVLFCCPFSSPNLSINASIPLLI